MMQDRATEIFLMILVPVAAYCIVGLQILNGFFQLLNSTLAAKSSAPPSVTGYTAIDQHLRGMLAFFQPTVSGESPTLSFFSVYIAAQVLPMHTLVVLEGLRPGNIGRIVSYTTIWGLVYQTVPWGIVMPIYFTIHFMTSATRTSDFSRNLPRDTKSLSMLPIALIVGFIVPTILAGIPPPFINTSAQQERFLVLWQGFPLWIAICLYFLPSVVPTINRKLEEARIAGLRALRTVYTFCLLVTGFVHLSTILFVALPSLRSSYIPIISNETISLQSVFSPMAPWSPKMVNSIPEGCLILLQYDMYFACGAAILWALARFSSVSQITTKARLVMKTLLWVSLVGPGGAALGITWDRDEELYKGEAMKNKGVKRVKTS